MHLSSESPVELCPPKGETADWTQGPLDSVGGGLNGLHQCWHRRHWCAIFDRNRQGRGPQEGKGPQTLPAATRVGLWGSFAMKSCQDGKDPGRWEVGDETCHGDQRLFRGPPLPLFGRVLFVEPAGAVVHLRGRWFGRSSRHDRLGLQREWGACQYGLCIYSPFPPPPGPALTVRRIPCSARGNPPRTVGSER